MGTTINYGFPYPDGTNAVVVHSDVKKLADKADEVLKTSNDQVSADLASMQAKLWEKTALTDQTVMDELTTPGAYRMLNGTIATQIGLPLAAVSSVEVLGVGTSIVQRQSGVAPLSEVWQRERYANGTVWGEWRRTDHHKENADFVGLLPASPGSLAQTAISCTTGFGGSSTTGQGFVRALQQVPTGTTRIRVGIRNWNPRYNMADSPSANIQAVHVGVHNGGTSQSTNWVKVSDGGVTGTDGFRSEWLTLPAGYDNREILVAFGWDSAGTVQNNIGYGFTGASASNVITGTASSSNTLPFFIYMEIEVPASKPKVAVFGDSLSSGVSSSRVMFDSWLDQYCRPRGYVPMHWSHSGDQFANPSDSFNNWLDPNAKKWSPYGKNIVLADAAFMAMGSNRIFATPTPTLQEVIDETTSAVTFLRQHVSPNVYGATILPRTAVTGAGETLRRQYNAWMKKSPLFRDVFDMSAAVSLDDETLNPAYDADGIHLNTAGYAAMAAAVNRPVVGS